MNQNYSKKTINTILKSPYPRILLNVCTHGNERVGLKVAEYFDTITPTKGTFIINIANKEAVRARKRFIDHDLNRIFPGKKKGSHEEMLAYTMRPFVKAFDVVLDIHSTESGLTSSLIITKLSKKVIPIIKAIAPEQLIYMKATKSNALMSEAKIGIGFEYGKDKDEKTYTDTVKGIHHVLEYFSMYPSPTKINKKAKTNCYEAYTTIAKPEGFVVNETIQNFTLVKKGEIIGHHKKTRAIIRAEESFYPILFGKNSYKTMFGFAGKKFTLDSLKKKK